MKEKTPMSPEAQQIASRVEEIIANYPTLDEALACQDCRTIFKRAYRSTCPRCSSRSLWNIGRFINRMSGEV
jgi:uncharacterized paraquat-inducible protein A